MKLDSIFTNINALIKNNELHAFYQPIYDVEDNKIVAAEALARIVKKDGKIYPPNTFLPFIEESIDALTLDYHIIEDVCKLLSERKKRCIPLIPITINISKMHIYENDFVKKVTSLIEIISSPDKSNIHALLSDSK